jgi:hypothetical protein
MTTADQADISPPSIPVKPFDFEYGYFNGEELIGCSKEQLIKKCKEIGLPAIELVGNHRNFDRCPSNP